MLYNNGGGGGGQESDIQSLEKALRACVYRTAGCVSNFGNPNRKSALVHLSHTFFALILFFSSNRANEC